MNFEEITVKSQQELDNIPADYKGRIYIEFGTLYNRALVTKNYYRSVVARGNSSVVASGNSSVEAWGNSSVEARENSSVVARGNSSVEARENSSVEAWENSSVEAWGNSSVEAWGNSSVVARGNSSVVAWENSSVVARGNSSVVASGNSSVEARENSSVVARGNSSVEAWENSSVEAWGNSSVEAWGNSSVEAWENSSVEAWGNSSVEAWGNSSVVARGNSSVVAWENSSVEAWENSTVDGSGNTQVVDRTYDHRIKISGNARIVYMPKNIFEFMDFYNVKYTKTKATFYKAVKKVNGKYISNYDRNFIYEIGKLKKEKCDLDETDECSYGIHISYLNWALEFGSGWDNLAIIECEVKIKDIVMPNNTDGKVRTSEIKVIREVPLSECGVYGKILEKRKKQC